MSLGTGVPWYYVTVLDLRSPVLTVYDQICTRYLLECAGVMYLFKNNNDVYLLIYEGHAQGMKKGVREGYRHETAAQ